MVLLPDTKPDLWLRDIFKKRVLPVAKQSTITILLCIAVQYNWCLKQLNIFNAFLHGVLDEEAYLQQPQGFVDPLYPNSQACLQTQQSSLWSDNHPELGSPLFPPFS